MKSLRTSHILLIIAAIILLYGQFRGRQSEGWQAVSVQLDETSAVNINRKQSHPHLAEYVRLVTVIRAGRELAALEYPRDTGGGFPMQIRFYADSNRELVRLTDALADRLIDLRTGKFVADETPLEGKESTSAVREAELPALKRAFELGTDMKLVEKALH